MRRQLLTQNLQPLETLQGPVLSEVTHGWSPFHATPPPSRLQEHTDLIEVVASVYDGSPSATPEHLLRPIFEVSTPPRTSVPLITIEDTNPVQRALRYVSPLDSSRNQWHNADGLYNATTQDVNPGNRVPQRSRPSEFHSFAEIRRDIHDHTFSTDGLQRESQHNCNNGVTWQQPNVFYDNQISKGTHENQFQSSNDPIDRLANILASSLANNNLTSNRAVLIDRLSSSKNLPRFSGDPLDWNRFKCAYECSTTNGNFSERENLSRLYDALKDDALDAVKT